MLREILTEVSGPLKIHQMFEDYRGSEPQDAPQGGKFKLKSLEGMLYRSL